MPHSKTLYSTLNLKVFLAHRQYQGPSYMHISKQSWPSPHEHSRKPDGEAMKQRVTNTGCEVCQTWAWVQAASLHHKLLDFPEPHEEGYSLPFEPFLFNSAVMFWRELSLMTFTCNPQGPLINYEPLEKRCLSLDDDGWWRKGLYVPNYLR